MLTPALLLPLLSAVTARTAVVAMTPPRPASFRAPGRPAPASAAPPGFPLSRGTASTCAALCQLASSCEYFVWAEAGSSCSLVTR